MANNPLYDNSLRHFLNFKTPDYGRVEITEPINFDAFSFKVKQANDRFGRDKEIGGDEIDLEFGLVYGIETTTQVLINGTYVNHLSHRLDLIFEALKENGSECEIEYILSRNNVDFVNGLLDIPESTTDGYSYFKCSVVQNTNKALIERKKDVVVNVFSETDTFNLPITPVDKEKILLKAKPVIQESRWQNQGNGLFSNSTDPLKQVTGFNYASFIVKSEIQDTFTVFQPVETGFDYNDSIFEQNFKLITALNDLSEINIKITQKMVYEVTQGAIDGGGFVFLYLIYGETYDAGDTNPKRITLYNDDWAPGVEKTVNLDDEFTYKINGLTSGESIWLYWGVFTLPDCSVNGTVTESIIDIDLTSTEVDSVIDGVRYYDFLKQGIKSLSGLDFEADDIETGEFKDQYIFNGNLIRQKDNVALNFIFKDEVNDFKETNSDYQIFDDKIGVYQYPEFYNNIDMGAFLQVPDLEFERIYNDRFKKITLEYGYKTFEQDKDEQNTIDAFHTEAQFLFPNKQVDDSLKVDINHIRDPFTIETARREAIGSTTALSTDDKIFIIDCVELPEESTNTLTRSLQMQVQSNGLLYIRSNGFKWTLLGFENGDHIFITSGKNQGEYTILQHGDDILELVPQGFDAEFSGTDIITIEYPLTGVFWVNRTNEGFDIIEGIENPDNCSNIKYTIKRNLMRNAWSSYLATICKDVPSGIILNTDFKVNGNLRTQFEGGDILVEKDNIPVAELPEKILNKLEYNTKVITGFDDARQLIDDVIDVRGFIRIYDTQNRVIKIHPKLLNSIWADGAMEITGEARNESDYLDIFQTVGGITISEIGYNQIIDTSLNWFKIDGEFVQIFDNYQKPLINATNFRKIRINGELFTSDIEFYKTLDNL